MGEAIFEVREVLISLCTRPGCPEWARWEIRLLGEPDCWRVCSRHKRWAKKLLVEPPVAPPATPEAAPTTTGQGGGR